MKEARQLRELAAGHRAEGRPALAEKLEADARALDGKGKSKGKRRGKRGKKAHEKEGGSVAKKKAKKAGKKAGKRATGAKKGGKKGGRKKARSAAQKAATKRMLAANKRKTGARKAKKAGKRKAAKRKTAKKKPAKRAAKKRTGNIKTGKRSTRKKAGKRGGKKAGRKKNPTKARSGPGAPPHPGAKKGGGRRASKHITKAQREAAMGDTANVYMDLRSGKLKTAKQVARSKNPSGSWWSVWWTFFGVVTGLVGTELLDRGVATVLSAKEIEEVEGDGGSQMGAQGRDAFRRIMLKPGMARILSMFGAGGAFFIFSGLAGKKMPLFSDWLMGNGAAAWGLLLKKVIIAYGLPMLPGAVKDGPEVTWQNRIIPEYQDVPQAELQAYVDKVLPQIIDHTTNRMDGRERYDRMGLPWNMDIEHADANAPSSSTIPGPDGAQAGLGAAGSQANSAQTSRLMATRAAAQAAARDYEARFAAPSAVGDCCDGCRAGKTCEAACPKDGHSHDGDMTNTTIPPTVVADRSGGGSSSGGSAIPQPGFEATRPGTAPARMLTPGGSLPLAPTRDAAALLSRTEYAASQGYKPESVAMRGVGNLSAPPGHWYRRGRAA